MFGWPDPNTGFDQSEHALYTRYFINVIPNGGKMRFRPAFLNRFTEVIFVFDMRHQLM